MYVNFFSCGANVCVFRGRAVNAKIKTRRNSHAPVFHIQRAKSVVGVVSALKREYCNHENFLSSHSAKICTLENFLLYHNTVNMFLPLP